MGASRKMLASVALALTVIVALGIIAVPMFSSGSDVTVSIEEDTDDKMTLAVQKVINDHTGGDGTIILSVESSFILNNTIVINEGDRVKIVSNQADQGNIHSIERIDGSKAMFIVNGGSLTFDDVIIDGKDIAATVAMITVNGGYVYVSSGAVLQNGNSINDVAQGGAIQIDAGNVYLNGGKIVENVAINGGAIRIEGGSFTMNSGDLSYNTALRNGGAIVMSGDGYSSSPVPVSVTINGGVLYSNKAIGTSVPFSNTDAGSGGAIHAFSKNGVKDLVDAWTVTVNGGIFSNNIATHEVGASESGCGAAINIKAGVLSVSGATFEDNTSEVNGGAIHILTAKASISNSTFTRNEASNGGAVYKEGAGALTISGCIFEGNESISKGDASSNGGGALYIKSNDVDKVTIESDNFTKNHSMGSGGAIKIVSGHVEITKQTYFSENSSSKDGGAIDVRNKSVLDVLSGNFLKNTASECGGAISIYSSTVTIGSSSTSSRFDGNGTNYRGGALFIKGHSSNVTLYLAVFTNNMSVNGGGMYIIDGATVINENAEFKANTATNNGGAISLAASSDKVTYIQNGGLISDNIATGVNSGNNTGLGSAIHIFESTKDGNQSYFLVQLNGGTIIAKSERSMSGSSDIDAKNYLIDMFSNSLCKPNIERTQGLFIGGTVFDTQNVLFLSNGCSFAYESANATQGFSAADNKYCLYLTNVPATLNNGNSVGYVIVTVKNESSAPTVGEVNLYPEYESMYDVLKVKTDVGYDIKYNPKCVINGSFNTNGAKGEVSNVPQYISNGNVFEDIKFTIDGGVISYYRVIDDETVGDWIKIANPSSSFIVKGYKVIGDVEFEVLAEDPTHVVYSVDYMCGKEKIADSKMFFGNKLNDTITVPALSITGYGPDAESKTVVLEGYSTVMTFNYTIKQYTITFNTDGGTVIDPITQNYGTAIQAPADPTKIGYTFTGWNTVIPSTMPAENITITASWKIKEVTITFDSNGGSEVKSITQNYGTSISVPIPTREGYEFKGWDPAIPATMPAEDMSATAEWKIKTYELSFISDGKVISSVEYAYGAEIPTPENPTREGYTFNGWDKAIPATMPANDVEITAKWSINKYTVQFVSDGSIISSTTQDYGTKIIAPKNPSKTGYTFDGWNPKLDVVPAYNVTIEALWIVNSYTITFNSNGGSDVKAITQNYGTNVVAPSDPTREGYTFTGWDKAIPATMPAGNITITAKWQINSYTITFDSNGGSKVDSITQNYGTNVAVPRDPTRTGYTFTGWDKEIPTTMPAENLKITAQWKINEYTLTLTVDGKISEKIVEYGNTVTLSWSAEIEHYISSVKIDGKVTNYTQEQGIKTGEYTFESVDKGHSVIVTTMINKYLVTLETPDKGKIASSTTLGYLTYGTNVSFEYKPSIPAEIKSIEWKGATKDVNNSFIATLKVEKTTEVSVIETVNTYNVVLTIDGKSDTTVVKYGESLNVNWSSSNEHYISSVIIDGVEKNYDQSDKITSGSHDFKSITSNHAVTVTTKINQYTITFDSNGGSEVVSITQGYGTSITAPAAPTMTGYTFAGWSEKIPETMPAGGLNVKASWTINQYTITFNSNGGSVVESIKQDYNTEITAPVDPTREGYTFAGWDVAVPEIMPAKDMTITANWTINQYTITFNSNGGSPVESIEQDYDSKITAPKNPIREGYTFAGWAPKLPEKMPVDGAVVTAQWTANVYKLSVYSVFNGATTLIDVVDQVYDQPYNLADIKPEVFGYTFDKWFSGNPEVDGSEAIPEIYTIAKNSSVYATFVANTDVSYTVSYVSTSGSKIADDKVVSGQTFNTEVTENAMSISGYVVREGSQMMALNAYDLVMVFTYDRVIVPEPEPVYYKVTIVNGSGGVTTGAGTYLEGSVVTLTVTTEPYYKFTGWYVDGELVSKDTTLSITVTGDVEYYAEFAVDTVVDDDVDSNKGFNWWWLILVIIAIIACVAYWRHSKAKKNMV